MNSDNESVVLNAMESSLDPEALQGWEWFWYLCSLVISYLWTPVLVLFLFPVIIVLGIYLSAFLMYIVRLDLMSLVRRMQFAVWEERDLLKAGREVVATLWDTHVSHGMSFVSSL